MHIYVDESGVFAPSASNAWSVSCVGALAIPSTNLERVENAFVTLKRKWGVGANVELKGSRLSEKQFSDFVEMLETFDVVFSTVATDLQAQKQEEVEKHKNHQANKILEHVDERFSPEMISQLTALKTEIGKTSNPLYVQTVCFMELLYTVVQQVTLYYAQKLPNELGEFVWVVDAKGERETPVEKTWKQIILPMLQSKTLREPFVFLKDSDYSHFYRLCTPLERVPEHLEQVVQWTDSSDFFDPKPLYSEMSFGRSDQVLGLQMADILTTCCRRALSGRFRPRGYGRIGRVMLTPDAGHNAVRLITIGGASAAVPLAAPYRAVIETIDSVARPIILNG